MSDLLEESAEIRKEAKSICKGNKDEMIGVLAMQLAIERRKNTDSDEQLSEEEKIQLAFARVFAGFSCNCYEKYNLWLQK